MDKTFMTIHNLSRDANIEFASESIMDILGYRPADVVGKSCFDFFHPDETPFARTVHERGLRLDKAAVLHYARILASDDNWVNCECCFTIVYDVIVACVSIYNWNEKSERRAAEAPQIRRIFSCSPRDPRYHMLEYLSPRFRTPIVEPPTREARAALILNRFTRTLTIMFATDTVAAILGARADEVEGKSFYECIDENCLADSIACIESAKANDSIAYLRFWSRDPRRQLHRGGAENRDQEQGPQLFMNTSSVDAGGYGSASNGTGTGIGSGPEHSPGPAQQRQANQIPSVEVEAIVSCTSDGLVVVTRRARPLVLSAEHTDTPSVSLQGGMLFAAPWGYQAIMPAYSPISLHAFQPPLLPRFMPLRPQVETGGNQPIDRLFGAIRDMAVFAWALVGINGTLAGYASGTPRQGASPPDGLPVWDPDSGPAAYPDPQDQTTD